jgi:hypothetical protein
MNDKLKHLKEVMIRNNWGKMEKPNYPRPHVADWLIAAHPEIFEEYKNWFDDNVRDVKNNA